VSRTWEPIVVGLGAAYLVGLAHEALHVYGMW
jgi:hypothetical protein